MRHLTSQTDVTRADQVAIVGDRLFTDVLMANMMGSWAVWVNTGVVDSGLTLVCFFFPSFFFLLGLLVLGGRVLESLTLGI